MSLESINTPLESFPVCILCLQPGGARYPKDELTKDHIIPRTLCDLYNPGLKPLLGQADNKFKIHAGEHREIDANKLEAYRNRKLIGLFEYIAMSYPRSVNPQISRDQELQIVRLFVSAHHSLFRLNGNTPQDQVVEYQKVLDFTREYLEDWFKNVGDHFVPKLDLSGSN